MNSNLEILRHTILTSKPKPPKPLSSPLNLEPGWLLPVLLHADSFLWGRWDHWCDTVTAKKVIDHIPQLQWQRHDCGRQMLEQTLACIPKHGGWNSASVMEYFLDWLLFGFGQIKELPKETPGCEGAGTRLYQTFILETLLAFPHDYLGDILAESCHGRGSGFYPTPMDVVQLIVQMTLAGEDVRTKKVCDPALGTGRMLLCASNHSYRLYGSDINPTVLKVALINGFLYAPWLVRPFPFLDQPNCDPQASPMICDSIARHANDQMTEHDPENKRQLEPIKKRRLRAKIADRQTMLI